MISCWRCFKRSRSIWSECNLSFCWVTCSDCDRPETPFNSHDAEPEGSTAPDVGARCKCTAIIYEKTQTFTRNVTCNLSRIIVAFIFIFYINTVQSYTYVFSDRTTTWSWPSGLWNKSRRPRWVLVPIRRATVLQQPRFCSLL